MASGQFNYFYNLLEIPSEYFKVFYSFNPSGSYSLIPSISGGDSAYNGVASSPTSNFFSGQSVQVSNASSLHSSGWTMFFVFDKSGDSPGTLFSNFSETSGIKSGFSIGVNSSNRLYVESYDENGPAIYQSNTLLGTKNAVAITRNDEKLHLDYFDFNSKNTIGDDFTLSHKSMARSDNWFIGDNINKPNYINSEPFYGKIDTFIYITGYLFPNEIDTLFSGFCVDSTPSIIYKTTSSSCNSIIINNDPFRTNLLLKHASEFDEFLKTGISINTTSKYKFSQQTLSNNTYYNSVTGFYLESGINQSVNEDQWVPVSSGYLSDLSLGFTIITHDVEIENNGQNYITSTSTISWEGPGLTKSTVIRKCKSLVGQSLSSYGFDNNYINQFGMNGVAYLNYSNADDISEFNAPLNTHNKININLDAVVDRTNDDIILDKEYQINNLNLYMNGVALFGSGHSIIDNTTIFDSDYYINFNIAKANIDIDDIDEFVYDEISGNNRKLINFPQDLSGFIANINPNSSQIFLNGVKLISGIDYNNNSSKVEIINSGLFNVSGVLFSLPFDIDYNFYQSGNLDSIETPTYPRNTSLVWVNGVRQDLDEQYLEIPKYSLLYGKKSIEISDPNIFSFDSLFWENYDGNIISIFELIGDRLVPSMVKGSSDIFEYRNNYEITIKSNPILDKYFEMSGGRVVPKE